MRILVLDDSEERLREFNRRLIGHVVDCARTAPETIEFLKTENYDVAFFDHDLGGQIMVPSGPGTGYEVAKWLEENPQYKPETIYIHSFNTTGAENMKKALPEAIISPGAWVKIPPPYGATNEPSQG